MEDGNEDEDKDKDYNQGVVRGVVPQLGRKPGCQEQGQGQSLDSGNSNNNSVVAVVGAAAASTAANPTNPA